MQSSSKTRLCTRSSDSKAAAIFASLRVLVCYTLLFAPLDSAFCCRDSVLCIWAVDAVQVALWLSCETESQPAQALQVQLLSPVCLRPGRLHNVRMRTPVRAGDFSFLR